MQEALRCPRRRLGTSAAAGLLHAAGLFLGDQMIGARASNPYGHYEDVDAVAIDEHLLASAGSTWMADQVAVDAASVRLRRFVRERDVQHAVWGVKDPRLPLVLGAWREALGPLDRLVMVRRPGRSIRSLLRREARLARVGPTSHDRSPILSDPQLALRMWITTNRALLEESSDRVLVVTEASLRAGFPLVAVVEERFGLGLAEVPTFDVVDPRWDDGPVDIAWADDALVAEANGIYDRLAALEPVGATR